MLGPTGHTIAEDPDLAFRMLMSYRRINKVLVQKENYRGIKIVGFLL